MTTATAGLWRRTSVLAVFGGLGFWVANLAVSLTPIAAEYRSALSISYVPMLVEALVGGLVLGVCVAYPLIRYPGKGSTNPLVRSLALSGVALGVATLVFEVPSKLLAPITDPMRYFLIGLLFNVVRILALGVVVGLLAARRTSVPA